MAARLDRRQMGIREEVLDMCWEYLKSNFSKFTEANKIKIALALGTKDIPTQVESTHTINQMPDVKMDGRSLEFLLGTDFTKDTRYSPEAISAPSEN